MSSRLLAPRSPPVFDVTYRSTSPLQYVQRTAKAKTIQAGESTGTLRSMVSSTCGFLLKSLSDYGDNWTVFCDVHARRVIIVAKAGQRNFGHQADRVVEGGIRLARE